MQLEDGVKSDRCCVYVSGVGEEKVQKLLGVPEIPNGTGSAQEKAVTDMLIKWDIFEEVTGVVFDTTASNSGKWQGACALLEKFLKHGVLWLACRHHMYELHIKHVVIEVTGVTKDPGVALFKRLKREWNQINIDYNNLKS